MRAGLGAAGAAPLLPCCKRGLLMVCPEAAAAPAGCLVHGQQLWLPDPCAAGRDPLASCLANVDRWVQALAHIHADVRAQHLQAGCRARLGVHKAGGMEAEPRGEAASHKRWLCQAARRRRYPIRLEPRQRPRSPGARQQPPPTLQPAGPPGYTRLPHSCTWKSPVRVSSSTSLTAAPAGAQQAQQGASGGAGQREGAAHAAGTARRGHRRGMQPGMRSAPSPPKPPSRAGSRPGCRPGSTHHSTGS